MSAFGVRSEVVPPRSDAVSAFSTYGNPYLKFSFTIGIAMIV